MRKPVVFALSVGVAIASINFGFPLARSVDTQSPPSEREENHPRPARNQATEEFKRPTSQVSADSSSIRRAEFDAYRSGGLSAAASVTGSFEMEVRYPTAGAPESLDELIAISDRVVIGAVEDNIGRGTADGRSIVTIYTVRVEQTLKGLTSDTEMSLVVLGGKIGFPDGSTARVRTPGFSRPTLPLRRIFFVHDAPSELVDGNEGYLRGRRGFVPSAGPLGIFDLSQSRGMFVHPAGDYTNPMAASIQRAKFLPEAFIQVAKDSIARTSYVSPRHQ